MTLVWFCIKCNEFVDSKESCKCGRHMTRDGVVDPFVIDQASACLNSIYRGDDCDDCMNVKSCHAGR
jgi:hypothetical protein